MNNEFDNGIQQDKGIDMAELRKLAEIEKYGDETGRVGSDWIDNLNVDNTSAPTVSASPEEPVYTAPESTMEALHMEDGAPVLPDTEVSEDDIDEYGNYVGSGLVIDDNYVSENDPTQGVDASGISGETMKNINAYMAELDEAVEEAKEIQEAGGLSIELADLKEGDEENEMTEDEFNEKYGEAVVLIDKTRMGHVINFTDEERAKMEKASSIRLEEVETIELNSIKTKKMHKKDNIASIIKKTVSQLTTPVVLGASGYTANMRGLSAQEIVALYAPSQNPMTAIQTKWSVIYDKIDSSSLQFKSFDDFLRATAAVDMDTLIYGMLCSTYPKDDIMPLTCDKCGQKFEHKYSVASLIRAEQIGERLQKLIAKAIDNSYSIESAKAAHAEAPVSEVKRIKLPDSGIIIELYLQSAYDLINKSIKGLKDIKDSKYNTAMAISTAIRQVFIPDDDGSYFEIDDPKDVVEAVYNLSVTDLKIVNEISEEYLEGLTLKFGLMNVKCPHCGTYTASVPMEIDQLLFYKYQQEATKSIRK